MSGHFKWQAAVLADKSLSSGTKLVLLVIGARMNKKGGGAFPSYKTIAEESSMSRRSVITHVECAVAAGWMRKEVRRKSAVENDSNMYRVSYPDGSLVPADGGEIDAPPVVQPLHHLVQPLHHPSEAIAPPVVQQLHPNTPVLTHQLTQEQKPRVSRVKKSEKTFAEFRAEFDASGQPIIAEDDPIYSTAEQMGLPDDYIAIAWTAFAAKYVTSDKKYKDWKAAFRNAVREDWMHLWNINRNGEYFLTNAGKMIEKAMNHGN